MFKKDIYKYKDSQGRVVISPYKPDCEYEHMYRLIAQSQDYRLTNYTTVANCVDIPERDLEIWFEVHKDDLETPISQNEEVKNMLTNLQTADVTLEELVMIGFSAIDEIYRMILGEE